MSVYEGLYGELPLVGMTREEYVIALHAGQVRGPPPDDPVPSWVREAVVRGLSLDPEARFPSMTALLTALTADPERVACSRAFAA